MSALVGVAERALRTSRGDEWRREFIVRHGGRCHYCNREGSLDCGPSGRPWHVDHMEPIALGGSDDEENLVLGCKRCNLAKGIKPYARFRALAAAAYWQPDDGGLSEAELDGLQWAWDRTQRGKSATERGWRISDDSRSVMTDSREPGESGLVVDASGRDPEAMAAVGFIVQAHALVPRLLAEIQLLRNCVAAHERVAA